LYTTLEKLPEAVKAGLAGLECLGVILPATQAERQEARNRELSEAAAALGGRRIEDLLHAKGIDNPEQRAGQELLCDMMVSVYRVDPGLYPLCVLKFVNACLEHGHSDVSAQGYMTYGYILAVAMDRWSEGHAFGKLALALNEKFHNAGLTAKLCVSFGYYLYVGEPLRAAVSYFESGRRAALSCGDLVYLPMNCSAGRAKASRGYMADAYLGYLHWGAVAKAEDIARDYGHLLPSLTDRERRASSSASSSTTMTTLLGQTIVGNLRDAALIVRAAQAIAGENMLPKVIERLAKIVLESAGAEKGALLLAREGRLFVEATFGVDPELIQVVGKGPGDTGTKRPRGARAPT
jgi:hypothetical protein